MEMKISRHDLGLGLGRLSFRLRQKGAMGDSNSRPPAPKAGIIPLDQ